MGRLEHISGPQDLRDLDDRALTELASEIRDELIRTCAPRGGHLGPNLGVVELTVAIHRVFESPRDRVVFDTGHQAYVHKMLTGRAGTVRHPAQRGRAVRLPEPDRVRARHRRELARLHLALLRRRVGQGLLDPRRGPPRRGRHRRRRADRRHGVGGAEQHRRRRRPPPGDRGQRQRTLLHADRGRTRQPPHVLAHQPALRADPRPRQAAAQRGPRRRPGGVRRPARHEEGHEGRTRAPGPLRGPRPEVRRPDRRPRPPGDRAGTEPGQEVRRPGDRARAHPQGLRLRPGRAQRGRPVPPDRAVRRRDRRRLAQGPHLDRLLLRGDGRPRCRTTRTSSRSRRRCSTPSASIGLPRRTPSAPSTSASPSSTPPPAPRDSRWAACTRWWRSTRPSSTGPSTRC